ncbi:poly-gamma-glutamate biosynthesis protein PgsC [Longispora fulva]|uniref:Poly-gamma-glutamate biosynthesis protein PgsC/CapC n=1 Tax=Longispora fulva TaxID=619741 RepID=A0A8J7KQ79_9ACTN|nr:poly-gamma-glutamate biosynthesis protein PgsC/CapC [Longispora fulva]MBG6137097.1 poly-gamma-glutamate biosynthesis protein PgsC/CapC [Longispora fulva]GIG61549.1 poly-gamma-glutamate biosynthesis protein PgsC [Longispora fulva]
MNFGGELSSQLATACLGIGLVFALVCYLTTNLSPGGMITPGWIALALVEDYRQACVVFVMTGVTWGLTKILQRVVILYGKRLFAAIVLLSVVLQLTVFMIVQQDLPLLFSHQTLGFVAPGLIAYQLVRQPPRATLLATGVVTAGTYVLTVSGILAGLVPVT